MSKADWLEAFDEVERDYPDIPVDQQNAMAEALVVDRVAAKADELRDRAKYEGLFFSERLVSNKQEVSGAE